jgi:lysine-N-methylase
VDEDTYQAYQQVPPPFGQRLREQIVTEADGTHHFRLGPGDRCPFWNDQHLCDIYATLGEPYLCAICDQHPRFHNEFANLHEMGFGLCCEEASRMLFRCPEPLTLLEVRQDDPEEEPDGSLTLLLDIRTQCFHLLQDRSQPLGQRLTTLLFWADKVQAWCDQGGAGELPRPEYCRPAALSSQDAVLPDLLDFFHGLESSGPEWDHALQGTTAACGQPDAATQWAAFRTALAPSQWCYEHLAFYFLYRYLLYAAEDGDLLSRVKLSVVAVLLVQAMDFARWQSRGGRYLPSDRIDTTRVLSKELEYSEENLAALLDELPFYTVAQLSSQCHFGQ